MRKLTILLLEFKRNSAKDFAKIVFSALFACHKICIYAKELNENDFSEVKCPFADKIEKGDIQELNRIKISMVSPPWEFCCHEYDGVKDFFMFKDDNDEIGHITWIYYPGDPNQFIKLGPNEAELKYGLTIEKYRGKRLLPETLVKIQKYLKQSGRKRVLTAILSENHASRKATERAGFELKKLILFVKLLGIRMTRRYSTE